MIFTRCLVLLAIVIANVNALPIERTGHLTDNNHLAAGGKLPGKGASPVSQPSDLGTSAGQSQYGGLNSLTNLAPSQSKGLSNKGGKQNTQKLPTSANSFGQSHTNQHGNTAGGSQYGGLGSLSKLAKSQQAGDSASSKHSKGSNDEFAVPGTPSSSAQGASIAQEVPGSQ